MVNTALRSSIMNLPNSNNGRKSSVTMTRCHGGRKRFSSQQFHRTCLIAEATQYFNFVSDRIEEVLVFFDNFLDKLLRGPSSPSN
jgi:hypothetical protein